VPKYTKQIVVFIDILGFSNMLPDFEKEAMDNDSPEDELYHESPTLNRLLQIFQDSVRWIREKSCNHYLFSDNICVTIDYVVEETEQPTLFLEMLQLVNLLNYEFIREGYFIRGGVDAGWFLDSRDMAVGVPLVNAYRLESETAVHPRVIVSESFYSVILQMRNLGNFSSDEESVLDRLLVEEEGLRFINGYVHIQNFEDSAGKKDYLMMCHEKISAALNKYNGIAKVYAKYKWTAEKFDAFLEDYIQNQERYELAETWEEEELFAIRDLKIN